MINKAVENWEERKHALRTRLENESFDWSYSTLVKMVIETITDDEYEDFSPDPKRIETIDHGDYQGMQLFVIGQKGYQPHIYYATFVSYGSCSGCDTMQAIRDHGDWGEPITKRQVDSLLTLALHLVQRLKQITDY